MMFTTRAGSQPFNPWAARSGQVDPNLFTGGGWQRMSGDPLMQAVQTFPTTAA